MMMSRPYLNHLPFDAGYVRSFLFFTVALKDRDYPRGKYAQFTREVNKRFMMPIVVLFRAGNRLTIGFVGRPSTPTRPGPRCARTGDANQGHPFG